MGANSLEFSPRSNDANQFLRSKHLWPRIFVKIGPNLRLRMDYHLRIFSHTNFNHFEEIRIKFDGAVRSLYRMSPANRSLRTSEAYNLLLER